MKKGLSKKQSEKPTYRNLLWCIGILVSVFLLYFPVLGFDFVNWDDTRYVYENPHLEEFNWDTIAFFFSNHYFLMYLPITMLTYLIEYQVAGLDAGVYHATNIVLHLFNTAFLFYFCLNLLDYLKFNYKLEAAVLVAVLFGVHPFHVESVVWIAERKDVLYTFFYLLSLNVYLKHAIKPGWGKYALSLFFFLLALLAKAQAMPLAVIIIALDYWLNRKMLSAKVIIEKVPFLLLAIAAGIIAIISTRSGGTEKMQAIPFYERLVYACYAYGMYILKLFVPFKLSAIYPFPGQDNNTFPAFLWFFPPIALAMAVWFFMSIKKNKGIAFGIAFFTFSIIPVLQIFSYHNVVMADRYSYVSSIGILLLIAVGLEKFLNWKPKWLMPSFAILAAWIVVLFLVSHARIPVWKSSIPLWTDVISKYPQVSTAYYNRGIARFDNGDFEGSLKDFRHVIANDDDSEGAYFSLGNTLDKMNDLEGAVKAFSNAIAKDSMFVKAYANRGIIYARKGEINLARKDFNKVLTLDTTHAQAFSNRANVRVMLKDFEGAMSDYNNAIKYDANYSDAFFNRGMLNLRLGKFQSAISDFDATVKFQPNYPQAFYQRGIAYSQLKEWQKAIADFSVALRFNPGLLDALFNRAIVKTNVKDFEGAIADYSKVIKAVPQNPVPYYRRAMSAVALNKRNSACEDLKKAYSLGMKNIEKDLKTYCK